MEPNNRRFLYGQLMWLGIYFGISVVISMFVPFPYSLGILIAVILGISYYRRTRVMKRMGDMGGSMFGNSFASKGVEYYCINCGTKHNKASCPNCGSRLKKAGF